MAEYIEREAAIGFVKNLTPHMDGWTTLNAVEVSLQNTPAADVVEVRHGEWVDCKCSACGEVSPTIRFNEWEMDYQIVKTPYCPNCGAKMDRKED